MKNFLYILFFLCAAAGSFAADVVGDLLSKPSANKYEAQIISEAIAAPDDSAARKILLDAASKDWAGAPLLFNLGNACFRLGLFDEAVRNFNAALQKQKFFLCYKNLAFALEAAGKTEEARRTFAMASAISGNSDVQCLMRLADYAAKDGDCYSALSMCSQALIYSPDNMDLVYAKCLFLSRAGLAEQAGGSAFAAFSKSRQSRFLRVCAKCAFDSRNYAEAAAYLEMLLRLPDCGRDDKISAGDAYFGAGAYRKAAHFYAQASGCDAKLQNAAFAALNNSDAETAEFAASKIEDKLVCARVSGIVAARLGRTADAEKYLETSLAAAPDDAVVLAELADARFAAGKFAESAELFSRLRSFDGCEKTALFGLLRSAIARKNYKLALALCGEISSKYNSAEVKVAAEKLQKYADELEKSAQ